MPIRHRILSAFLLAGVSAWIAPSMTPLLAQVAGATLSGVVTDPAGAVVPGAQLTIQNTATGISAVATTNSSGLYSATNLTPARIASR
jgi:hypothetical protein